MGFVYVLTMEAVYDHGCCGVFSSREDAEAHGLALFWDSDGHHLYRVDEVPMGVGLVPPRKWMTYPPLALRSCPGDGYLGSPPIRRGDLDRTPIVEFVAWRSPADVAGAVGVEVPDA